MADRPKRDSKEARALVQRVISLLQPSLPDTEDPPTTSNLRRFVVHLPNVKQLVTVNSQGLREIIEQEVVRELGGLSVRRLHMPSQTDLVQAAWALALECLDPRHTAKKGTQASEKSKAVAR